MPPRRRYGWMTLSEVIARVEDHEKALVVVNPTEGVTEAVREHFDDRNVRVERSTMAVGPDDYLVLGADDEFLAAAAVDDLLDPEPYDPAFDDHTYRPILDALDETMFTSHDRGQMLAASREIEDRAWRVGRGELHAGFQYVGNIERQRTVYERLGGCDGLEVHVYAHADGTTATFEGVSLHCEPVEELRESWFVVFDGDGVDGSKCALLAEEREDGLFYGFWTYDPATVDYIVDHLTVTYVRAGTDDGDHPERPSD